MKALIKRQLNREDGTYTMEAFESKGRPYVVLTQVHARSRHVAGVSVTFPMKETAKAVAFVENASEAEWERGINKIKPLLDDADRINGLLTQFNRPAEDKRQQYEKLLNRKRYKSWL